MPVTDVLTVLRRRLAIVLLGALLGVGVGFLLTSSPGGGDRSVTARVEVLPTGVDLADPAAREPTALDLDRVAARLTSPVVLEAATAEYGAPFDPADLAAMSSAAPVGDGPLVEVTVTHPDTSAATAAADAVVEAHLAGAAAEAVAQRDRQRDELEARLDDLTTELSEISAQLATTDDPARTGALEGQREASLRRAAELERALVDLAALNVEPGRVAQPARAVPPTPAATPASTTVPVSALVGLLAGVLAALLTDRIDRRVWEPDDLARATGSATVVHVPRRDLADGGLRTGGGHRRLRAHVAPARVTGTTILVTGSSPDHGAGVAAGLAVAVAASGRRTLLVDTTGANAFDLPSGDLDGWLAGRVHLDRAARSPEGVETLQVLSGTSGREPATSATMRELLDAPNTVVVVHATGGSDASAALGMAELVEHVVLVAAARRDRADDVRRMHGELRRPDAAHGPVAVLAG